MSTDAVVRRRLPAPERREQLLDNAAQLIVDHGFHALSIESVAQQSGVTRAVIYQHFSDLGQLLDTLLEREMARAFAQAVPTAPVDLGTDDPREVLLAGLSAFLHAVLEHPRTWRLVLIPPEGAPPGLRTRMEQGRGAVLRQLSHALQPAPGQVGARDPELTARVLSAIADEYARLALTDPDRYPLDRLLGHARTVLHDSLLGD